MKKTFTIPIYEMELVLVVTSNIRAAHKKCGIERALGEEDGYGEALLDSQEGTYFLFMHSSYLNLNTIAHEVFHVTHRVLAQAGVPFDALYHEPAAYLNGYLMELVASALISWKLKKLR